MEYKIVYDIAKDFPFQPPHVIAPILIVAGAIFAFGPERLRSDHSYQVQSAGVSSKVIGVVVLLFGLLLMGVLGLGASQHFSQVKEAQEHGQVEEGTVQNFKILHDKPRSRHFNVHGHPFEYLPVEYGCAIADWPLREGLPVRITFIQTKWGDKITKLEIQE